VRIEGETETRTERIISQLDTNKGFIGVVQLGNVFIFLQGDSHTQLLEYKWVIIGKPTDVRVYFSEKNIVFWDIRTQFVLHRRHITSPLQGSTS
jgi:hypothetical protein